MKIDRFAQGEFGFFGLIEFVVRHAQVVLDRLVVRTFFGGFGQGAGGSLVVGPLVLKNAQGAREFGVVAEGFARA